MTPKAANFPKMRVRTGAAKAKKEGPKVPSCPVESEAESPLVDASVVKAPARLNRKRLFGSTPEAEVA